MIQFVNNKKRTYRNFHFVAMLFFQDYAHKSFYIRFCVELKIPNSIETIN